MTTPSSWHEAAQHYLHREQRRLCPDCPERKPTCGTCWNAKDLNGDPECRECGRRFPTPPPAWTQRVGEDDIAWNARLGQMADKARPHGEDCIYWCSGVDCDQLHACWCADSAERDPAYDSIANQQELRP